MWDLHTGDLGPARVSELERRAVAAFGAWSMPICTEFTADYRGLSSPAASGDGRNTISVVSSGWVEVFGFAAGRAATTDVRAEVDETGHGRIVEADIYLNFEEFTFGLSESSGLDATAVLLHEIGHLAGLLHPCGDSGAPACSSEAVFAQSVLHPDTTPSSPRTLSSDDEAGICALYPSRPITCKPACGPREMCFGGVCSPCSSSECGDCDGGLCLSRNCYAPSDCSGATCSLVGDRAGECVPSGTLGSPCAAGADCASGRCLTYSTGSFCTVECVAGEACGDGLTCRTVEGMQLCVRATAPASCAASHQRSSPGAAAGVVITAIALGLLFAARRARLRASGDLS